MLLVFEGEPSLPVRRVGGVLGQPTLLRREQRAAPAHLVVVRPLGPRNRRHRDPVWIQMPMVRQRHVGVGEGLPVLPVPPRLVHRDVQAPATRAETRRRRRRRRGRGAREDEAPGVPLPLPLPLLLPKMPMARVCGRRRGSKGSGGGPDVDGRSG